MAPWLPSDVGAMRQDVNFHSHPSKVEHWRHVIEIVAIIVAAVWGFYVFIYQERIKPATAEPRIQHSIKLEHEVTSGGKELVRVDASFKNIGESVVQLNAMVVNVYGVHFASRAGETLETPLDGVAKTNFTLTPSKPIPLYSFFDEWRAMGAHKEGNLTIEPGLEWHEYFVFAIPRGAYDAANVIFYFCASRPTNEIWPSPRIRQPDGTSMYQLPAKHDGLTCGFQRSGLSYAL